MKKLIYVICLGFNDMTMGEMMFVNVPFNSFALALKYAEKMALLEQKFVKSLKKKVKKKGFPSLFLGLKLFI